MSSNVQVTRKDSRKGRNKVKRVVTTLPTTQAPPMEYKPIDLIEEELDEYYIQSKVSKKQRKKTQGEVDLSSSFAFRIRDFTKEELEAEGCRKIEAPKPGPQPGAQPGPQPAEVKPVSTFEMAFNEVVAGKKQVSILNLLTKPKANLQETKWAVFQISEQDFQGLLSKGDQVSRLEEEKVALLHEVERLNKQLKRHEVKAATNHKEATASEAVTKMDKLREALEGEKQRQKNQALQTEETFRMRAVLSMVLRDIQTCAEEWTQERNLLTTEVHRLQQSQTAESRSHLPEEVQTEGCSSESAQKKAPEDLANNIHQLEEERVKMEEELNELKASLHQAQEDLKNQRQQLEEERSHRLSEKDETRELKAALLQAQEDLRFQRYQWEQERRRLMEEEKDSTRRLEAALRKAENATSRVRAHYEAERFHLFHTQQEDAARMKTALCQFKEVLEHYRSQWLQTSPLESISNTQQTPEKEGEEERAPETTTVDDLNVLDGATEEVTPKKPKKSLRKRFLGLFKRKRQTPSDGQ